jgi:hypothetical protein
VNRAASQVLAVLTMVETPSQVSIHVHSWCSVSAGESKAAAISTRASDASMSRACLYA